MYEQFNISYDPNLYRLVMCIEIAKRKNLQVICIKPILTKFGGSAKSEFENHFFLDTISLDLGNIFMIKIIKVLYLKNINI